MMKPNYVFPTCIGSDSQIDLAKQLLPVCLEYINSDGVSFNKNTNHLSTYENREIDDILNKDSRLLTFKNYISSLAKDYCYINNIEYNDLKHFFVINKLVKNSSHTVHTHQNAILSGLIYLKVSELSSPVLFRDPRQYRQFIDYKICNNTSAIQTFSPILTISPKVGDVLIWPSWLEHEVPYNANDDERITLVFNLEK